MRITYLSWTVPYPPDSGGKNRTYNLSRYLAEHHKVHFHVPSWGPLAIPAPLQDSFTAITAHRLDHSYSKMSRRLQQLAKGVPPGVANHYTAQSLVEFQRVFAAQPADLIFIDEAHMAPYAWPLTQVPCILARQKADYLYYRDVFLRAPLGSTKLTALVEWLSFRLYENRLCRRFKYGVVASEAERKLYLGLNPALNLAVIPNGVDVSFFRMMPLPTGQDPIILLHGMMSYYANIDAAIWFVEEIFPLILKHVPRARLFIVGQDPAAEVKRLARPDQIIVTGGVPDMRDYLCQSNVVVTPIRIGHGTRLKIPEAMAAGRPVVSTFTGAEGLEAEIGKHLLLAEDPIEFAASVVEVLTNPALAKSLATNARHLVEDVYSWRVIGENLDQYCQFVARSTVQP